MVKQKSGVILTVTSGPARTGIPMMGGVAPAMSAVESLSRGLSAELAPHGVRVVGLRPLGMPDSDTIEEVYGLHAKALGISRAQFQEKIAGRTHARRLPSLLEMANTAAFVASDDASAMTGTIINLSMGSLDD
jgi:NAD(P)-dependent dehydrogenase (short-subunit alcohol dehydrogenase family)